MGWNPWTLCPLSNFKLATPAPVLLIPDMVRAPVLLGTEFSETGLPCGHVPSSLSLVEPPLDVPWPAERMGQIGIDVRDPSQAVGTMSGGERQCLAISRAIYFGAKVLVLDEPTSALGVHQASVVLKYIVKAASQGLAVILITHNVHHAYPVGNSFTVLNRGKSLGTYEKKDISREKLLSMMAGGEELDKLEVELKEMNRIST